VRNLVRAREDYRGDLMAGESEFTSIVRRLAGLRGVSTLTAFGLAVEIGDWHRFTGNSIGSFVGLVPSEHPSGASRVQGSITKTGNTHSWRLGAAGVYPSKAPLVGVTCTRSGRQGGAAPPSRMAADGEAYRHQPVFRSCDAGHNHEAQLESIGLLLFALLATG
jgi:transposase